MIQLELGAENSLYAVASFVGRTIRLLKQNCNFKVGEPHETQLINLKSACVKSG